MEEDGGVKAAPVTRLRRRLSVEQSEDTKSPSTPSTPTKKRGGRLAAKPQLELIDENAPQNTPKRTPRRSLARDVEPAEEKLATPARRSTRAKSNTSLVVEMEAAQSIASPRAKRAARRNSQLDSDNEAPITPARTRRTRKDSTTSVEKIANDNPATPGKTRRTRKDSASNDKHADNEPAIKPTILTEVISEEPEIHQQEAIPKFGSSEESKDQNSSLNAPRKSPRLKAEKDTKSTSSMSDTKDSDNLLQENKLDTIINSGKSDTITSSEKSKSNEIAIQISESDGTSILENNTDEKSKSTELQKYRLSLCSVNLVKSLDAEPTKKVFSMNKSTSALNHSNSSDSKRHRTKSWTTLTGPSSNDSKFFSDNESTKKKFKKHGKMFNLRNQADSGNSGPESQIDDSKKTLINNDDPEMNLSLSSRKKKKNNENKKTDNDSIVMESFNANKSNNFSETGTSKIAIADVSNESNKENVDEMHEAKVSELLFQTPISSIIQSMIFIEDSDSNMDSRDKSNKQLDGEDQCVPVVDHESKNQETENIHNQDYVKFDTSEQKITYDCCEPMDIDETMPDNIIINDSSTQHEFENDQAVDKRSSLNISQTAVQNITNITNKSKRMPSESISISQDLEKTGNENKSTLVLSQIKDVSSTEHNVSKSLQESNSELLSKSVNLPNVAKNEIVNQNLSVNYLTSTPVQHKDVKLGMQMNTSVIASCDEGKKDTKKTSNKKELSKTSNSSSDSSEEEKETEESSNDNNDFVVDQSVDAGEDYESGDSRDEEERNYEKEHEILEHGETLTSEDEVSNDSDYEKDSFIVSSDEEDNNLLSGSGDDLDMSDNELTMSAKSKKKFNERSLQQQKNASKEMFEARHKLKAPDSRSNKNKRRRLDSLLLESEDDNSLPPKKNKRMRLDSTWESSITKSEDDESVSRDKNISVAASDTSEIRLKKRKKVNRLSESICESDGSGKDASEKRDSTIDKLLKNATEHTKKKSSKYLSKSNISENREPAADKSVDVHLHKTFGVRHKTGKGLSESVYNESILNEKEITICDKSIEKDDPLLTAIKQEIKTPNKGLEISTIQFTTREDIEQVNVNEDTSIIKPNVSSDPLRAIIAEDSEDEDDSKNGEDSDVSSISENEEITNNYDSVLNELNKDLKRKEIKSFDISLNLNKKTKKKVNAPIMAELNITQTKTSSNKNKLEITGKKLESVVKKIPNSSDDEATNDSIQLRLLFSEDSNDSSKSNGTGSAAVEQFIPLKRSEGKINIPMSASEIEQKESSLNISSKKKNKTQKLTPDDNIVVANASEILYEPSLNTSSTKKKPKSIQNEENATTNEMDIANETSLSTSSKKKSKKNKSAQNGDGGIATANEMDIANETSLNTSSKKKSKKNKSVQNEDSSIATANEVDIANETSLNTSSKKKSKKNKSVQNEDSSIATANEMDIANETSLSTSSKKKSKKNKSAQNEDGGIATAISTENILSISDEMDIANETSLSTSSKKKSKNNKSAQNEDGGIATANEMDIANETSLNTSSKKKSKRNKSVQNEDSSIATANEMDIANETSLSTSSKKKSKKNKSAQNEDGGIATANEMDIANETSLNTSSKKKSKKNKSTQNEDGGSATASELIANESLSTTDKKFKKRKLSQNKDDTTANKIAEDNINFFVDTVGNCTHGDTHVNDLFTLSPKQRKNLIYFANDDKSVKEKKIVNKKRKERDDDDGITKSKILKQSSFDEIIPRLPETIINSLDDQPRKSRVVSTTQFLVESNRRKNKPSNFLEKTVYLNTDTESPQVNKKAHIKKPKVLPFIPTASTSHAGFTTNFKVISYQKMDFVAQSSDVANFKNDYLSNMRIKKLRTYDLYKRCRNAKLSKY